MQPPFWKGGSVPLSILKKLGYKIREAQMLKTPYMLVIGDNEVAQRTVSVRLKNGQTVNGLSPQQFAQSLQQEISERMLISPLAASAGGAAGNEIQKSNMNQEVRN